MTRRAIDEAGSRRRRRLGAVLAVGAALLGVSTEAQVRGALGGVTGSLPNVGQAVGPTVSDVTGAAGDAASRARGAVDQTLDSQGLDQALDPQTLLQARSRRLADLIARNRPQLEADPAGDPVVRGEVVSPGASPASIAAAQAAGFSVLRRTSLPELGIDAAVLAPPPGMSAREAVRRLRRLDPAGTYDFNHLYFGAGEATGPPERATNAEVQAAAPVAVRLGVIDTGVSADLPVFAGVAIRERGFAPGAPRPAAHGVAVASLVSGRLGAFHGAAPGASLDVADIYGATPAGGSAEDLAAALEWMAEVRAPVVSVSLVGPANALVGAAVAALGRRGTRIVATVGNDGPAAPPAYPASYPGVIAVAPVDARGRVLPEAGRALHVDFAAPGAGFEAATLTGGLSSVRGASFAAPIVAGRLARLQRRQDPDDAAKALAELAREARPAGQGAGRGVIGDDVRLADSHPH